MNKSEFVKSISDKSGATLKDTEIFLDSFVEAIVEAMAAREEVNLVGFGTFSVADRAPRMGRDFKTGKNIRIGASRAVKFKAGKTLKDSVR